MRKLAGYLLLILAFAIFFLICALSRGLRTAAIAFVLAYGIGMLIYFAALLICG